jgi:3-oxoacyl-[acyl-carrier protein] reductase
MTKTLAGKVALVTGGSRGIGAAIAKRLARDGAAVAVTYASSPQKADEVVKAVEAERGRALALRADSVDTGAVQRAITQTVQTLGRLDVLVNNAGIAVVAPLDQFSLDDFDRMVAVIRRGLHRLTPDPLVFPPEAFQGPGRVRCAAHPRRERCAAEKFHRGEVFFLPAVVE